MDWDNKRSFIRRETKGTFGPIWTPEEDEICRRLSPDYKVLEQELPNRTLKAIQRRCSILGVHRSTYRWSSYEKSKVIEHFEAGSLEELARILPTRSIKQIRDMAWNLGLHREKPPFKKTGYEDVDYVRAKIREFGWVTEDIDVLCETTYFRRVTIQQPNWHVVRRALKLIKAYDAVLNED